MSVSSVVGIDVAKAHVDVFVLGAEFKPQRFVNEAEGHSDLAAALASLDVRLVVMQATGGYEAALACALQAAGFAVAVVNPKQARDFAKGMGYLAKTDAIDARALAAFADALARQPDLASTSGRSPTRPSATWLAWSLVGVNCWRCCCPSASGCNWPSPRCVRASRR